MGLAVAGADLDLAHPDLIASGGLGDQLPADVDILVNNAGIIRREEALTVDASSWNRVLDVNLTSLFFLTQRVAGPMVGRGSGKIINIASLLSFEAASGCRRTRRASTPSPASPVLSNERAPARGAGQRHRARLLPRGGFKESGWGRDLGSFGLDDFTELKTVITAL